MLALLRCHRGPIRKDEIARSRQCMVCIGTGYTRRKFGDFLGMSKLERCVGCMEGQEGRMRPMERWLYGVNRCWLYREERGPSLMREK